VRNFEYHRGYNSGRIDGIKAGHSHEWLAEHIKVYAQIVEAKDAQIALLQNRNASLINIIRILDSDDESGDSE
jgi:hypothetical protein